MFFETAFYYILTEVFSYHQINFWSNCFFHRKYSSIHTDEERDQYRAVFNDQYAEYKELHAEVQAMAKKFEDMDEMMRNLPSGPSSQMVQLNNTHRHTCRNEHRHTRRNAL